ncbi:hypothetical protein [Cellulosimicrobium sp. RS]|uniref:hypothetical protein n=1 Tax=Cellulosimicrobium sp. RS TaxID=3381347 RepID=UPI0038FC02D6
MSATVAVAASAEQTWRALLVVLGIDAEVPGVPAAYGAMAGRVRDAVPGDGLVVRGRLGARTYEFSAHLVARGVWCDLTVDAAPDDLVGAVEGGRWRHHLARRRVRQLVRDLVTDVARTAGSGAGPVSR